MREIASAENERFKAFSRLCRDKKARDGEGVCVIDGAKLCADAASSGIRVRELWVSEEALERYRGTLEQVLRSCGEVYLLKGRAAERLSDLKAPQGVFAVADRPAFRSVEDISVHGRLLGLCGLQSPENAAAAVRTAAALGYGGVLLTPDCADIWSPRSIRAGAGAQFVTDICVTEDMPAAIRGLREKGFTAGAAALTADAADLRDVKAGDRFLIVVGNEGHGLPREVVDACDCAVMIPMTGAVESLNANAAASVLMWELRKDK